MIENIMRFLRNTDTILNVLIKVAIAIFIALWATNRVHAQEQIVPPTCFPGETAAHNDVYETQPADFFHFASNPNASFTISWWCDEKYVWHAYGWMGFKRQLVPDFLTQLDLLKNQTHAQNLTTWDQYFCLTRDANNVCTAWKPKATPDDPVYGELVPFWRKQATLSKPKPLIWQVKVNPGSPSRPVFNVANGVRNTTAVSNNRVIVGATCDCVKLAVEETSATYCDVSTQENVATPATDTVGANRVAVCARLP